MQASLARLPATPGEPPFFRSLLLGASNRARCCGPSAGSRSRVAREFVTRYGACSRAPPQIIVEQADKPLAKKNRVTTHSHSGKPPHFARSERDESTGMQRSVESPAWAPVTFFRLSSPVWLCCAGAQCPRGSRELAGLLHLRVQCRAPCLCLAVRAYRCARFFFCQSSFFGRCPRLLVTRGSSTVVADVHACCLTHPRTRNRRLQSHRRPAR